MTSWLLLALGLVLIFIEFYLPGAVMGSIGAMMIFASVIIFAMQSQSPMATAAFLIGTIVLVGFLIKFSLWRIRTAKPEYSIYSDGDQGGFQASSYDETAIGQIGVVITDLKPGGYILVNGKQQQAISESGYLAKGSYVEVISGQEESLIVKKKNKD